MAQTIIDWLFSSAAVANGDGSHAATVQGATQTSGPGNSALGARPTALAFAPGASCRVTLSPGAVDARRFAVRVLFRATAAITTRNNLLESNALPFALFLEPGLDAQRFNIVASVDNGQVGWTGASTANRVALELHRWYVASLVYDLDTLALLVDDAVVAVTAFPRGGMRAGTGDKLFAGSWTDGARWPFTGEIAGVQVWNDIPEALEAKLDAERGSPEWHLSWKENQLRPTLNLGPKTGDFYFDTALRTWIQSYALSVIGYTDGDPAAFVLYGAILTKWRSDANLRAALGPLASDEIAGRRSGSRKSVFRQGCIYWSPATGAVPVLGRMYLDYELIGEGASAIGLPAADEERITGGRCQRFQHGRMYYREGASNAFEIHGSILEKYLAAGGHERWGFPITHENDVVRGDQKIGKVSELESCTIFWSGRTGAAIIYGAIRATYLAEGGPAGALGFPTSDESDIPSVAGPARYNTFERGSILWFNGPVHVCRPFRFHLGRLDTREEDRDIFDLDGQNDLYARICIDVNGGRVFDRKIPENGTHYGSANILDVNYNVPYEINPNDPNLRVALRVEVWESDSGNAFGGGNDHLGTLTQELSMANAWGLRERPDGLFSTTGFGPWVNRLDWSIKPTTTDATPFDFWGVTNRGTSAVEWREYAAAFGDVDPDFELDFGIVDDALKALYYELVVKGVASSGNCFGMALESIYAWKEQSRLGRPLSRFTSWGSVENDFNVKHCYQAGADAIWWFLGQFISGNTHDPKHVFHATRDAFHRGLNPVICIAQNYDFSGAPHCIVPVAWDDSASPWRIEILDPNFQNTRQTIFIDPTRNTFRYQAGSLYEGGAWAGGRLHYMPWSVLNHRQRTPVWDAILLLLTGTVVIFADSTEVTSLTDQHGAPLDAANARSGDQRGNRLLRVPGLRGDGPVKGAFYVGRQMPAPIRLRPEIADRLRLDRVALPAAGARELALGAAARLPAGVLRRAMGAAAPPVRLPVPSDASAGSLSGPGLLEAVRNKGLAALRPSQPAGLDTILATLRGRGNGKLDAYVKRPLQGVGVQGDVAASENVQLGFHRMSDRDNEVSVQSERSRQYQISLTSKLGAGKDFLRVRLQGLSAEAGKALRLNVQPGITAVDVLAAGAPVDARVIVDGRIDSRNIQATFEARVQGGIRLALPDRTDPSLVKLGQIDHLQGAARAFRTIKRQ